jgi:hypothetical protein
MYELIILIAILGLGFYYFYCMEGKKSSFRDYTGLFLSPPTLIDSPEISGQIRRDIRGYNENLRLAEDVQDVRGSRNLLKSLESLKNRMSQRDADEYENAIREYEKNVCLLVEFYDRPDARNYRAKIRNSRKIIEELANSV